MIGHDAAATLDLLGRKQPQRLNFIHFARAIPGYIGQFNGRVPDNFYVRVDVDAVEVACPCGASPRCERLIPTGCECGRTFAYTGRDVRVAYTSDAQTSS